MNIASNLVKFTGHTIVALLMKFVYAIIFSMKTTLFYDELSKVTKIIFYGSVSNYSNEYSDFPDNISNNKIIYKKGVAHLPLKNFLLKIVLFRLLLLSWERNHKLFNKSATSCSVAQN